MITRRLRDARGDRIQKISIEAEFQGCSGACEKKGYQP